MKKLLRQKIGGLSLFVGLLVLLAYLATPPTAPPGIGPGLTGTEMLRYLTQAVCLDAAGVPTNLLPIDPACANRRPQAMGDDAVYRKHDWPDSTDPRRPMTGYQASDSVVLTVDHRDFVVQTFDFGDTTRSFGRFDEGQGDGGQVLLLVDGWASAAMTEDGGDGVQWFIGEDCRAAPESARRFLSWRMFRDDVSADRWHDIVTRLNKSRSADSCPRAFNAAYTRYRLERLRFPFRIVGPSGEAIVENHPLEVVISEHYGGGSIDTADHLERFFFARDLGLLRWERWANPAISRQPDIAGSADRMDRSGRCPKLDFRGATDTTWLLVDCRIWTTLVRPAETWTVSRYDWKALEAIERLRAE